MMLLAVLAPSERGGAGLGWGVLLVFSMIGGGMIPLMFLRSWMKSASVISPIRWSVQALEGGVWRGSSLAQVAIPCGVLLTIGVLGFAVGARAFRGSRMA
jgi:ABC-2 type transport system permease protein